MKKRLLAALLACILCFALLPEVALADGTININNLTSPPPGSGWSVSGSVVTITTDGNYTISGTTTTTNRIVVAQNVKTTITLKDVDIGVNRINTAALLLQDGADVTLLLEGTNVLKSGGNRAGIHAPAGTKLTIEGSGTLEAYGGKDGAGIGGGGYGGGGGTITIADRAIVNATGGWANGAGIGGGGGGNGGSITIEGSAKVNAFGSDFGAGIGGGGGGNGGTIKIAGSANVTATGGISGAGIGGGDGGNGGRITITGSADVKAYGGELGAGIGGGNLGNGGTITIAGSADVTAKGGKSAAGIGGGNEGNGEEITIQPGARVAATGGNGKYWPGNGGSGGGGAGIGGGGGMGDDFLSPEEMQGGAPGNISLPEGRRGVTAKGGTGGMYGNIKAGDGADIGYGGGGASKEHPNGKDGEESFPLLPQRMVPTYEVKVTCLGPGASNIKAPREVDAGSILRVKLYPEEGAALLSLTVNGAYYDPSLLKVEGEALIYGINRIDEDYELVAEFGEPVLAGVPEVEVTDPPKTGDAAASGGFAMLLVLAFGVALWRARRGRASS